MQDVTSMDPGGSIDTGGSGNDEKFVPKGAMAFFLLLLVVYALMWFSIYFELLGRK